MARRIIGFLAGLAAGIIAMSLVSGLVSLIWSAGDRSYASRTALGKLIFGRKGVVTNLISAFPDIYVLFGLTIQAIGLFVSAFICTLIVRKSWITAAVGLGTFWMVMGVFSQVNTPDPYPIWFNVAHFIICIPCAIAGDQVAAKRFLSSAPTQT